jgi:hypothetical protein
LDVGIKPMRENGLEESIEAMIKLKKEVNNES